MGELVFVRHGQASFGTDDYDRLSPLGWQQAGWLGEQFHADGRAFDCVATGTLRRHRETAKAIADTCGLPEPVVMPGLNEMEYDVLVQDAQETGVVPTFAHDDSAAFALQVPKVMAAWEDGTLQTRHEPFSAFVERVQAAVDEISAVGQSALIVSSGGPKALTLRRVLGVDLVRMVQLMLHTHNASYTRFAVKPGGLELAEFNATPHLAGPGRAHARTYV